MAVYYITLFALVVCGAGLCLYKRSNFKNGIFLLIAFLVLGALSALRYDVGYDYSYVYAPIYYRMLNDPTGEFLANHRWEPGFRLLLRLTMVFSNDFQALFIVTSFLIVGLVMFFFWRYSPNPLISVYLFIALSHFYCSMNFVRQTLAAAVAMYAFPLLKKLVQMYLQRKEKNAKPISHYFACTAGYFGIVLLAASFHMSALLLIPFFFVNLIPVNKYVLAAFAVVTAGIYFNTHAILEFVTRFWYQGYDLNSVHMQAAFSPQFTISAAVMFLVLFFGTKVIEGRNKGNYIYVSYAFFAFFFVLMGTRHSVIDRFSLLFILLLPVGVSILIHEMVKKIKKEKDVPVLKKRVAALATVLFVVIGGGMTIHHYALTMDHHGVVPFQLVINQPFYQEYRAHLRDVRLGLQPPIRRDREHAPEPWDVPLTRPPAIVSRPTFDVYVPGGEPFQISLEEFLGLPPSMEE